MTSPRAHRILVIGQGMAGSRLVDELLAGPAPDLAITVVGAEPYGAYNRILLSEVVAGRADVAALQLADPDRYRASGVDVRLGTGVVAIHRRRRQALLDDGSTIGYDRLVLATGASAVVPAVPGLDAAALPHGVHVLRTVDDCRAIVAAAANARQVVVVGGGALGLEVAQGLAGRGRAVTVLHGGPHPLDRQLDATGGTLLARLLSRDGVQVRCGTRLAGVGTDRGAVSTVHVTPAPVMPAGIAEAGVAEAGAAALPADLVVLACGVRPETELARRAGLAVERGVLVDDTLTTSDPAISAIGDCAEVGGEVAGLVAPAWEQARVLAARLSGDDHPRYAAPAPVVRLTVGGLDVLAAGLTQTEVWTDEPGLEVVQLVDAAGGRYVKAVLRDGLVAGAVSVGAARSAAELCLLVERRSPAPRDRATLLLPGSAIGPARHEDPTLIPDRATICRCNGVSKGAIVRAWSGGACSVAAVAAGTRATTGCGTCRDAVTGLLDWLAASDSRPAGPTAVPATVLAGPTA